ncbi:type I secretion system permease/ATPase [Sulfitobacter albidus]|uniref:Type I secretion system permease/ATPase n=1 Tax=Sulfitobacter albidus TaxID=2829501 RepID=A0A975JH01_9RHOB|nr:type I secretion system permease/ATPase [Sulfitobacter albidus]QUJ78100.1 type I secretion system permease/ATPase [Sulfitobacter albidus]
MTALRPLRATAYSAAVARLRGTFVVVALFSAAVNVLMLTGPMFMLQVYDRVLSSGSVPTLQALYLMVVVLFVFLGVYDFLRSRIMSRAAYRLDQEISDEAYAVWLRAALADLPMLNRPLSDLAIVRGFLSSPVVLGFFDLPWIPIYVAVCFFVHPWLGWLTVAGLGVVLVLALLNQFTTRKHTAKAMQMDGAESFFVEQSRRTAEAVLPMGMRRGVAARWSQMHRDGLATAQVGGDRGQGYTAASKAFRLLLQSSLLGLGGYLALQQQITAGMIVATSIIAGRALAPVDQVIGQWATVVRAREAHRRLRETFAAAPVPRPTVDLPPAKGHLGVAGVSKYVPGDRARERAPILDGVTFGLEPGDALGVIGPSASGKSTLARILVGATLPDEGSVRLDGATLDQWSEDALGSQIGYLPQRLELLTGTVRDNIARFDPEAADEEVIKAARLAGVHEMILQLPDGYATQMTTDAGPFSGGQLQRIGLARAVYGGPRYVVMDEPNSNLDAAGDDALSQAILALREAGSTVVVMAHRPSAIAAVNKVMVLHGGRVAEFGARDEILQKSLRPRAVPTSSETA